MRYFHFVAFNHFVKAICQDFVQLNPTSHISKKLRKVYAFNCTDVEAYCKFLDSVEQRLTFK